MIRLSLCELSRSTMVNFGSEAVSQHEASCFRLFVFSEFALPGTRKAIVQEHGRASAMIVFVIGAAALFQGARALDLV